MKLKDVAVLLMLSIAVYAVSVVCCELMKRWYALPSNLSFSVVLHEIFAILSILPLLVVLFVNPRGTPAWLGTAIGLELCAFTSGVFAAGTAVHVANMFTVWSLRHDGATFPIVFLSVSVGMQLFLVFFHVRAREIIVRMRKDGELPTAPLSVLVCGDYDDDVDGSEETDPEEYMDDPEFGRSKRKRKPSFKNRAPKNVDTSGKKGRNAVEPMSSESDEDSQGGNDEKPLLSYGAGPIRGKVVGVL